MAYLALVLPRFRHLRTPFSRDQAFLLLAAFNQFFIAIDIYLAHNISGGIKPAEWIPIVAGTVCGALLIFSGVIAIRKRDLASALANLVFLVSIGVGLLGAYLHLNRTVLLNEGLVSIRAVATLIWAPPVIGPLFFVLIGVLGISAAWIERPVDSGRLQLFAGKTVQMPYSKTRAYLLIVAIFILATLISSVLDHARFGFDNAWVWLPVTAALFGFSTSLYLGIASRPNPGDITAHGTAMLLLIAVGVVGFVLHSESSLTSAGAIVIERFLRGSPLLAPLLFCNVGLMGLLALLAPGEESRI
ncbi:MAG: hypothetical protein OXG60_08740 [Chloroflexi bacterium]|nr:hypothetical protein [Chloroflexota bacterium]